MGLVMDIADRVLVLDFGRQIAHGSPAEVQRDPNVIRAYLGETFESAELETADRELAEEAAPDAPATST
jgi:branched-chain amino acid transport system ATP-binding protein